MRDMTTPINTGRDIIPRITDTLSLRRDGLSVTHKENNHLMWTEEYVFPWGKIPLVWYRVEHLDPPFLPDFVGMCGMTFHMQKVKR